MLKLNVILLTSAIFAFCEPAAIVDKLNKKCGKSDNECQQSLYRSILQEVSEKGIPEMDIPKTDPYVIKERSLVAFGMVNVTITDGTVKGFKNCKSTSFKNDFEIQRNAVEFVCELISIEGNYKIESTPALLALIGGINIHGEGKGGVVVDKIKLNFDFAYEIKKHDDCELHFVMKPEDSSYTFEILGKTTLTADNLFIGKQEISTVAVNIFNENSEFITKSFGKNIIDMAMELFYTNVQKFYDIVPVKDLISDDLSAYVKS